MASEVGKSPLSGFGDAVTGTFSGGSVGPIQQDWSAMIADRQRQIEARDQQNRLAEEMWRRQQGLAPSVAELQMQQAMRANQAQAMQAGRSARGGRLGQALGQMQANQMGMQANIGAAHSGAMLRAQEQQAAEAQMAALYGQQRAQDLGAMKTEGDVQVRQGEMQAGIGKAEMESSDRAKDRSLPLVGAAGALFASSDKRLKSGVRGGDKEIRGLMDAIHAVSFEYNDKALETDKSRRVGVMAQDLEKSKVGKKLVGTMSNGYKGIDINKGLGAALAGLADINARLGKVEKNG